jgi:hypothetical protein
MRNWGRYILGGTGRNSKRGTAPIATQKLQLPASEVTRMVNQSHFLTDLSHSSRGYRMWSRRRELRQDRGFGNAVYGLDGFRNAAVHSVGRVLH